MKNATITIGSVLILILSAVVFVLVPALAGGSNATGEQVSLGKYNKQNIDYKLGSPFQTEYASLMQQMQNSGYDVNQNMQYYIFMQAFNNTVQKLAIKDEIKRSGYVVTNVQIDQEMLQYFTDDKGEYSKESYQALPKETKLAMRTSIKEDLLTNRYIKDMFGDDVTQFYGIKMSKAEAAFYNEMSKEERSFQVASYETSTVPDSVANEFFSKNSALFSKLDLSVISCEDESAANKLLSRINANEISFDDAMTDSLKYYSGTDGKCTASYSYALKDIITDQANIDSVSSLKAGEISSVIKTASGYSFFRCDTQSVPCDYATEEGVAIVKSYLSSYETGLIESYYSDKIKDIATQSVSSNFEDVCQKEELEVHTVSAFPLNYSDSTLFRTIPTDSAPELQGASKSEGFLRQAFSMKKGEVSEPLVLPGRVVVLHLLDITQVSDEADEAVFDMIPGEVMKINQSVVANNIMTSDKVENNSQLAYFKYFATSGQ